jgi:RNA polymerase sigma-70 factor (ECF subfamily)
MMRNHSPADQDTPLIRKFQEGDSSAFEALFIKYQSKVFNTAYRMLGDYEDARDMAQEVFIRAHRSLRRFRGDSKFYTWLYRITVNSCINKLKSQKTTVPLSDCDESWECSKSPLSWSPNCGPIKRLQEKELQRYVQNGINSLPGRYRSVIVLRDIQGLRYQEIAEILDCSLEAVRSSLYRARQELRRELKGIMPLIMNGGKK